MTLVNAADRTAAQTSANRETNTLVPGSFPQDIGARADRLAGVTGLPSGISSLNSGAVQPQAQDGAGSFPTATFCLYCETELKQVPGGRPRKYCNGDCSNRYRNEARRTTGPRPTECRQCGGHVVQVEGIRHRVFCGRDCRITWANETARYERAAAAAALAAQENGAPPSGPAREEIVAARFAGKFFTDDPRALADTGSPGRPVTRQPSGYVYQESTAAMASG